ncbi:MAG TPA: Maf family protein [Myxococcaceae bacterium]|nr:Maf family protein [Myxococcaceae bacterium]
MRLVLASSSPRRRELLSSLGLTFEVKGADIDEAVRPGESPPAYVERLAREKAAAVAAKYPGAAVLAADTSVVLEEEILGKPKDVADAERMLAALSGRGHSVLTGIAVAGPLERSRVIGTEVRFRPLSPEEIAWYARTGEPLDKAGAYAIQGIAGAFISEIRGSPSNVVGLPLWETVELLQRAGVRMPWEPRP